MTTESRDTGEEPPVDVPTADPVTCFVPLSEYQGEIPEFLQKEGFLFLPFEKIPEYITLYYFRKHTFERPLLMVYCGNEGDGGLTMEAFQPESTCTEGNGPLMRVWGSLSGEGKQFFWYDPNCRKHEDRRHVQCIFITKPSKV